MTILCLGGSYTARYLARRVATGETVLLASRRAPDLRDQGYAAVSPHEVATLEPPPRLVVDTVPAVEVDGRVADPPYLSAVSALLERSPRTLFVHLSSTSVYPSRYQGRRGEDLPTMDEDTPPAPDRPGGERRLALEGRLRRALPQAVVVRAGGIYGPRRSLVDRFVEGRFRAADRRNRMVSRVHVEDLGRLLLALARRERAELPSTINAVDECPSLNAHVYRFMREELGVQVPFDVERLPAEGRRIVSRHLPRLLDELRFPSYRQGFRHCMDERRKSRRDLEEGEGL